MAEIFLATQTGAEGFERSVIVKRILPALAADPHFHNMLVDEAHIAMTLSHGNVAQVLDFGASDGRPFLVMELVDGWDLSTVLGRGNTASWPLTLPLGAYVVAQVCRALAYAHGKTRDGVALGIVHRDISPQNVLLSEQGEVKLTDFGIAKALGRREQTQRGVIKGKLDFMSPEQALGQDLDARSDLFAAGAVLYLLVTGRRPFAASDELHGLEKVQRAEFLPADALIPDLPPRINAIINRAMQREPWARYGTADEMLADLEAVLKEELGAPGPSELKLYLAELALRDGGLPVSQAAGLESDDLRTPTPILVRPAPSTVRDLALEPTSLVALPGAATPRPVSIPLPSGLVGSQVPERTPPDAMMPPELMFGDHPAPPRLRRRRRTARWMLALPVLSLAVWATAALSSDARRMVKDALPAKWAAPMDRGFARVDGWLGRPVPDPEPAAPVRLARERRSARGKAERTVAVHAEPRTNQATDGTTPAATAPTSGGGASQRSVSLRLVSRPPGAEVRTPSGTVLGRTPLTLTSPAGSTHELTFAKAGFAAAHRRVTMTADRTNLSVDLPRPRKPARKR